MGALKPLKNHETVTVAVKIPNDLQERINRLREASKKHGYTIDISEAAIRGIRRTVGTAERELASILQKPNDHATPGTRSDGVVQMDKKKALGVNAADKPSQAKGL